MHFSSLLVGKYSPQNSCFSYDGEELYLSPEHNAVSYKEGCKFRGVYSKASNQYGWVRKVEPFTIENFLEKLDDNFLTINFFMKINTDKSKIEEILIRLRAIRHVEIIRIGTRTPVTLPQRITDELISILKKYQPVYIHTHFNHPKECSMDALIACAKLSDSGFVINNQMVLLNEEINKEKSKQGKKRMRVIKREKREMLMEHEARKVLELCGVPMPKWAFARNLDEAMANAKGILSRIIL